MLDDLKRRKEIEDDAFYGFSLGWPQVLALLAALLCIGLVLDAIERRAMKAAPPSQVNASVKSESPIGGQAGYNSAVLPLSHPLRGPDCDITITQRGAGAWGPERCARGVRK